MHLLGNLRLLKTLRITKALQPCSSSLPLFPPSLVPARRAAHAPQRHGLPRRRGSTAARGSAQPPQSGASGPDPPVPPSGGDVGPPPPEPPADGNREPPPPPKYPAWLQAWMAVTAVVYLFARVKWREDLKAKLDELQRGEELDLRADQEWSRFQDQFRARLTPPTAGTSR